MRFGLSRRFFHFLFYISVASCTLKTAGPQIPTFVETSNTTRVNPAPEIVVSTPQRNPTNTTAATASTDSFLVATPTPFDLLRMPVSACDQIRIEGDTTIPDGTVLEPGEVFIKAWKVQNSGKCKWSPDYRLALYQGDALGAPGAINPYFTQPGSIYELIIGTWPPQRFNINPGEIVDLVIILQAPSQPGSYLGTWALINDKGERVEPVFWVSINVVENLDTEHASPWAGEWNINDPYLSSQNLQIRIFEKNTTLFSSFYNTRGEMNLITAWSGKDPFLVNGEYGSPSQPTGNTLVWSMLPGSKDQFQGVNYFGRFTPYPWCGSRPDAPFPDPCLLTLPKED